MTPFCNAKWILADVKTDKIMDKAFLYKTSFSVYEKQKTTLYIAAHTQYAVYINGNFADAGQYDDYEDWQFYDAIDITDFCCEGENELAVWHYVAGDDFSTRSSLIPGIIFSVYEGEKCLLSSDVDCLSAEDKRVLGLCEKVTRQLGFTLDFDATAKMADFKPSVLAGKEKCLNPRPVKKLVTEKELSGKLISCGTFLDNEKQLAKAVRMIKADLTECDKNTLLKEDNGLCWQTDGEKSDGVWLLYDCDESAGLLSFCFDLPKCTQVLIGFGEHLDDGRVRTYVGGRNFCFSFIAKEGKNEFFYPLFRLGLRYLCFYIYSNTGAVQYAGIHRQHYPLNVKDVKIENPLHKKIYDIGVNTLSLCMHEHYEDCPWREQALYAMDSRIEMLSTYHAFGDFDFARASLKLFALSQRENGQIELCAPADAPIYIPSFTLCFVIEAAEYLKYSRDIAFLDEIYPVLKKIIDSYSAKLTDVGLISPFTEPEAWNFYEWAPGLDGRAKECWPQDVVFDSVNEAEGNSFSAPLNAYFSLALSAFGNVLKAFGRYDEEIEFEKMRQRINDAMNKTFWNEEKQMYASFTENGELKHYGELTQALMLCSGASDKTRNERIRELLSGKNDLVPVTLGSSFYKYEALISDISYRQFVFDDIAKKWGDMLFAGATSFWETFTGDDEFTFGGATSLCHGWASLPIYFYYNYGKELL